MFGPLPIGAEEEETTVVVVVIWPGAAPLSAACVRPCRAAGLLAVLGSLIMKVLMLLFVMMFVTTF